MDEENDSPNLEATLAVLSGSNTTVDDLSIATCTEDTFQSERPQRTNEENTNSSLAATITINTCTEDIYLNGSDEDTLQSTEPGIHIISKPKSPQHSPSPSPPSQSPQNTVKRER